MVFALRLDARPLAKGQQKTPTPSSARTKGRHRQICHWRSTHEAPGIRTRPSAVPPRIRRIVAVPARFLPRRARNFRAESGHRCNGLARTDLLTRAASVLQSNVSSGDLPRNGADGTCSRVTPGAFHVVPLSRYGAACAYSSQRASRHRPTVAVTIANDLFACQADPSLPVFSRVASTAKPIIRGKGMLCAWIPRSSTGGVCAVRGESLRKGRHFSAQNPWISAHCREMPPYLGS